MTDPDKREPRRARCSVCRHGRHLTACAYCVAGGPLDPEDANQLARHDWVEESYVAEDSIECSRHPAPAGRLEWFVNGRWCLYVMCPTCEGHKFLERDDWPGPNPPRSTDCPDCHRIGSRYIPVREALQLV